MRDFDAIIHRPAKALGGVRAPKVRGAKAPKKSPSAKLKARIAALEARVALLERKLSRPYLSQGDRAA